MSEENSDRRGQHRRYSDRRAALLLEIHEIIFEHPPGPERDRLVLEAVRRDFGACRGLLAAPGAGGSGVVVAAACGQWTEEPRGRVLDGPGLLALRETHRLVPGVVTLTYVRRPPVFPPEHWERLFKADLCEPSSAMLSVEIRPARAPASLLLLQEAVASREWSSQDRSMAEEVAHLLSRAADKDADS